MIPPFTQSNNLYVRCFCNDRMDTQARKIFEVLKNRDDNERLKALVNVLSGELDDVPSVSLFEAE